MANSSSTFLARCKRAAIICGVSTVALGATAMAGMAVQGMWRTAYVNDPVGRNVIVIESRAPLETMVTTTSAITGEISGNPLNILQNPKASFEVDLASLDTGIELRNEHMRSEGWLNTAKYPKAVFTMTKLYPLGTKLVNGKPSPATKQAQILAWGKTYNTVAAGTMELHGVKRPVLATIEFRPIQKSAATEQRLPGDLMHVRAKFPLPLADYGIAVPDMAKLKIAAVQNVTVDIFASTEQLKMPKQ